MISHVSLLYISLAPVLAYVVGAVIFSLIPLLSRIQGDSRQTAVGNYRNSL